MLKWHELANKLGWSQGYLSKVMHGYHLPSERMAETARPITKKSYKWWSGAGLVEVQALLNKLRRV